MIALKEIKEALIYGNEKGYELFPEIRDEKNITIVKKDYEIREGMIRYANGLLEEESPKITFKMFKEFEKNGNRLHYENSYFKRRAQLFSLVLAYILKKDKKYIEAIEEKLWEWCTLYSWELPAHFKLYSKDMEAESSPDKTVALFAAETAFFFAEILSVVGKDIDEFLAYRLKEEIFKRVINPYKNNSYWWETAKMNWASVCSGSVGAAAIYLVEDIDELSLILERVLKSMDNFIDAFDKDGLITEGLSYWNYGFSFYVYFSELLKERTSGKISLLNENDKIKKISELPQTLQFPAGGFVNFSDSGSDKWVGDSGLFSRLEKALGVKGYNYDYSFNVYNDHTYKWTTMARKLFWSDFTHKHSHDSVKLGKYYFSEYQWLIDRRKTEDGAFIAFAAKGGNNDEPHNHNDLGNFLLHCNGEDIFVDLGSPEYVKEYFRDETRYSFLTASSLGHSVPVINDNTQKNGKNYYADVLQYEDTASEIHFKLDLKNAYECEQLVRYEREFVWDYKNMELEIKDDFKFNRPNNDIREAFITRVRPEIIEPGKVLIKTTQGFAELTFNKELQCAIEECSYNDHNGEKSLAYKTIITCKTDTLGKYAFIIKLNDNLK